MVVIVTPITHRDFIFTTITHRKVQKIKYAFLLCINNENTFNCNVKIKGGGGGGDRKGGGGGGDRRCVGG
jgi:ribosomal protein S9